MSNPYLNLVNEVDAGVRAIMADGKLTGSEAITFGSLVWARFEQVMNTAKSFDAEDKANLMEVYGILWDKYVVPLDIPFVPEPLESKWVEPSAKWLIGTWLERQMDKHVAAGLVGSQAV